MALFMTNVFAATIQDVVVLEFKLGKENFELKLQDRSGERDSFFFVDVVRDDPQSFEKIALVLKKLKHKKDFKLSLEIPSFSAGPNGSYYRSNDILFHGSANGESLLK